MDCNFAIKVSMLMDGELSAEESETVRKHLSECEECQNLEKDFLFFREQIREPISLKDFESAKRKTPFWKKGIRIPAPVFAAFLLAFMGFGIWFLAARSEHKSAPNQSNEASLAKYDKGGRTEIYVVQNPQ